MRGAKNRARAGKSKKQARSSAAKRVEQESVEGLVERANAAAARIEPEEAQACFSRALELEPGNSNIMDALADVEMQLGNHEAALELLLRSTQLVPETNPCKWLYLSQLQSGLEALASSQRGIQLLTAELPAAADVTTNLLLRKQIAKAYCGVAEMYLTDLCYENDAEVSCEAAIMSALEVDPGSLDANQALANLRLSQNRKTDAGIIIKEVYSKLKALRTELKSRTVIQELSEAKSMDEIDESMQDIPGIDFFVNTAKLLIECGEPDTTQMAVELSTDMLDDDDENVELWYINGVAALSLVPPDFESAHFHLDRALEMMNGIKEACAEANEPFVFDEQYGLIIDHLRMIGDQGKSADQQETMEVDGGADEEWELEEDEN